MRLKKLYETLGAEYWRRSEPGRVSVGVHISEMDHLNLVPAGSRWAVVTILLRSSCTL